MKLILLPLAILEIKCEGDARCTADNDKISVRVSKHREFCRSCFGTLVEHARMEVLFTLFIHERIPVRQAYPARRLPLIKKKKKKRVCIVAFTTVRCRWKKWKCRGGANKPNSEDNILLRSPGWFDLRSSQYCVQNLLLSNNHQSMFQPSYSTQAVMMVVFNRQYQEMIGK